MTSEPKMAEPKMGKSKVAIVIGSALNIGRAIAEHLAGNRFTVNTFVPGSIETIRGAAAGGNHDRSALPDSLLDHLGHSDEVAALVRFLCLEEARYVTAQTIQVNGDAFMP